MGEFQVLSPDFHIASVVGESEEGLTLFIPKAREGKFVVTEGFRILTVVFLKDVGDRDIRPYTPWRE